jgi:hypothetical protein
MDGATGMAAARRAAAKRPRAWPAPADGPQHGPRRQKGGNTGRAGRKAATWPAPQKGTKKTL